METEQWLEEAVLATNRSLRLIPDSVLRHSIETCRENGISLACVVGAGSQMGLTNGDRVTELQERIPEPAKARPRPDEARAIRKEHKTEIESCPFLMNCLIGAKREIPAIFDFQPTDKKDNENIKKIIGSMADRIIQGEKKSDKGGEDGNGHNHSS